jgi:hypothetical protein
MPTFPTHRLFRSVLGIALATILSAAAAKDAPPNIVLMVADDLGYGDLGCQGATKIATPRIDSLAKDGVRFTDAHSFSGICMPSRYSILTGRYAFRLRRSMEYACNFDPGQILLPEVLRSAGVRLGETYPHPLIDHAEARQRALAAFSAVTRNR